MIEHCQMIGLSMNDENDKIIEIFQSVQGEFSLTNTEK